MMRLGQALAGQMLAGRQLERQKVSVKGSEGRGKVCPRSMVVAPFSFRHSPQRRQYDHDFGTTGSFVDQGPH